jgi:superfamily II DNA or RNA helicase
MDKLSTRIDYMLNKENDDFFINIDINPYVEKILYDYQLLHLYNLITAFKNNNVLLDGSDTGTGKTYTSIAMCKQLNLRPIVLCPKIMIGEWTRVCELFGVIPTCIINYECAKSINGNNYVKNISTKPKKCEYEWTIPRNCIVIFDEVHRCRNINTQNSQLLLASKKLRYVMMLSATLTDKPQEFKIFGYMLNLYNNLNKSPAWIKARLYEDSMNMNKNNLSSICSAIYPKKGSRMQISELKDKFPENKIIANAYCIGDEHKAIIAKYVEDVKAIKDYKSYKGDELVIFNKLRQYVENVKVNIIKELIDDHLEGFSIVVFFNYNENIDKLAQLCNTKCIVNGNVSIEDREKNIAAFQCGESNLIICNISVESISLHDVVGNKKRLTLISPNFSSTKLIQALGRVYRAGAQTSCLQKIIFCSGTYEEEMCNKIKKKLEFVEKLNSNELMEIEDF